MSKAARKAIFTANQVVIVIKGKTRIINVKNPNFKALCQAIVDGESDAALLTLMQPALRINVSKKAKSAGIRFDQAESAVYIGDDRITGELATTLLEFQAANAPYEPLVKFYENCKLNPDSRAQEGLFRFLQAHRFPLTEDGCFIGYRRVKSNFKDFYTGSIDYSVGKEVKMDRAACDSDRNNTCSRGLHVANFNYAKTQYHSGSGIMLDVKVNPKDVVAFPTDYNFEKLRVCAMYVVGVNSINEEDMHEHKELVHNHVSHDDEDESDDIEDDEGEDGAVSETVAPQAAIVIPGWLNQERKSNGRFGRKVK